MTSRLELAEPDVSVQSLGRRLRSERERRKISIASIAESTKILGGLIDGLEHDDVSRWPTGLYRRAFFRAYAVAIGLDPEAALKEFLECFPDLEGASAVVNPPLAAAAMTPALPVPYRLRCFAAAADWFVLSVIGLGLYVLLGAYWGPLCVAAAVYYAGGSVLLGTTPGVFVFAQARRSRRANSAQAVPVVANPPSDSSPLRRALDLLSPLRERWFSIFSRFSRA